MCSRCWLDWCSKHCLSNLTLISCDDFLPWLCVWKKGKIVAHSDNFFIGGFLSQAVVLYCGTCFSLLAWNQNLKSSSCCKGFGKIQHFLLMIYCHLWYSIFHVYKQLTFDTLFFHVYKQLTYSANNILFDHILYTL